MNTPISSASCTILVVGALIKLSGATANAESYRSDIWPHLQPVQFAPALTPPQNPPCSQWYADKILQERLGCSTQQIQQICTGQRPRPAESATDCSTPRQFAAPSGTPYEQFTQIAQNSGINLRLHQSYTEQYLMTRSSTYCQLLASQNYTKLLTEVSYPPSVFSETPADRSRLEVAILRTGTAGYCPNYWGAEQQFEQTYVR